MSEPRRVQTRSGRFYDWRGEKFWSVTTIINGGVPKPALINWAKKFTAEYAVDHIDALNTLVKDDPAGAVEWLKGAAFRDRDRAGNLGTLVHESAEAYVLDKPLPPWPPEAEAYMQGFQRFLSDWKPSFTATEASVYNRTERYAGTLDAVAALHGRPLLLDTKTGKDVYPEVALQLAAYRYAEFIGGADGSEEPMPEVQGAAVLHLRDDGSYRLVEVRADEEIFDAFLYVRECFRFREDLSKEVILGDYPTTWEAQESPVAVEQLELAKELEEIPF